MRLFHIILIFVSNFGNPDDQKNKKIVISKLGANLVQARSEVLKSGGARLY